LARTSTRHSKIQTRRSKWRGLALTVPLVAVAACCLYVVYLSTVDAFAGSQTGTAASAGGPGSISSAASVPAPLVVATARISDGKAVPGFSASSASAAGSLAPLAGGNYAGPLLLNDTGSQLASWDATSSYCPTTPGYIANGTVGTDSSGDATLTTNSTPGSCAALISPGAYSSGVIQAELDFPAMPGGSSTMANWTGLWLTDGPAWPTDGELDVAEGEPVDGVNAVTWHSGTSASLFSTSTSGYVANQLPADGPDLSPGWHTVDVVYTAGFFAVYYDGQKYTSYTSSNVTGDALNIYFTMINTANTSDMADRIGGPPVNSTNAPTTFAVKYLRVWSYR
jgi:hypothetical protein